MMKKFFAGIIATVSLAVCMAAYTSAAETEENQDYIELAAEVVEAHVRDRDNGCGYADNDGATQLVNDYLRAKGEHEKQYTAECRDSYTDYTFNYHVRGYEIIGDKVHMKIGVEVSRRFIDGDDTSGYGRIFDVMLDTASGKIVDIYEAFNGYDETVRGIDIDITDEADRLTQKDLDEADGRIAAGIAESERAARQSEAQSAARAKEIMTEETARAPHTDTNATSGYSYIDHAKTATYAATNYYKTTPSSGGFGVPYYDFSNITNAYDCTNFVSHALLYGEARIYDTGGTGISGTGWYYRNLSNRSSSWSGVNELYNFVVNNTTKGPGGYSLYYPDDKTWTSGDIMQFHNGSIWRHSTVITGKSGSIPLVTGRTSPGVYNNNEPATDIYSGYSKRILHLYNYGA